MLTVDEAVGRIVASFGPRAPELVPIAQSAGRVLAEDAVATFDHPPAAVSAMDGYAVRAADVQHVPAELSVIGEAPAGRPFAGSVSRGEAVRIFTGGVVPEGADAVVIQEDTDAANGRVRIREAVQAGQNVRVRGLDFRRDDTLIARGRVLTARDVALLAAADFAHVEVSPKPRVAIVATGDELSRPGEPRRFGGIVASSTYALAAMVEQWGGVASDLGILPDRAEAFAALPEAARDFDLVVTQGGASVGDHDLVQSALAPLGFQLNFWKIAMRPGKPLIFGTLGSTPLMGLPGNPVSAMVCAVLFLRPAIAAMLGASIAPEIRRARLGEPLKANGSRQDYIRARLYTADDELVAEPFAIQDSSMQKIFADADGLIIRPIGAPAAKLGDRVDVLLLD
jgi:molybdopterin molybdotransferase